MAASRMIGSMRRSGALLSKRRASSWLPMIRQKLLQKRRGPAKNSSSGRANYTAYSPRRGNSIVCILALSSTLSSSARKLIPLRLCIPTIVVRRPSDRVLKRFRRALEGKVMSEKMRIELWDQLDLTQSIVNLWAWEHEYRGIYPSAATVALHFKAGYLAGTVRWSTSSMTRIGSNCVMSSNDNAPAGMAKDGRRGWWGVGTGKNLRVVTVAIDRNVGCRQ